MWAPNRWVTLPGMGITPGPNSLATFGYSGEVAISGYRGSEDYIKEWLHSGPGTYEAGWPVKMFRSYVKPHWVRDRAPSGFELPFGELVVRGFPTNRLPKFLHAKRERRLPIMPMWGGAIINVTFWSILCFLPLTAYSRWQVRRKERAGHCAGRGYQLKGLSRGAVCPECGTTPESAIVHLEAVVLTRDNGKPDLVPPSISSTAS